MLGQQGGTCLGLTICRRLVEMMEGQIGLESEPDVGTTVSFTAWLGVGEPKAAGTVVPERLASLRVLVADEFSVGPAGRIEGAVSIVCRTFSAGRLFYFGHDLSLIHISEPTRPY